MNKFDASIHNRCHIVINLFLCHPHITFHHKPLNSKTICFFENFGIFQYSAFENFGIFQHSTFENFGIFALFL